MNSHPDAKNEASHEVDEYFDQWHYEFERMHGTFIKL